MKFVLVPKKCIVFELARKVEPVEIFEEIGIKFFAFDRNIYFDTKKGKGASKNDGDPSRCYIWIELKEGYLTYCRSWSSDTENFRKMLREGNHLRDAEGMKEIHLNIVSEIKDILEDIDGYNLKIQEEINQKKTEREKEDLEKEKQRKGKEEQEKIRFKEYILKSEKDWKDGISIKSDAFEELLKRNGIEIPLRTLGWIRNNLLEIGRGEWTFVGGNSTTISKLIKELRKKYKGINC